MSSEQQPRAGEVWGDPADTWSWVRVHVVDMGMVYFCKLNERGPDVYLLKDFVRNRQHIVPASAEPQPTAEGPGGGA